MATKVFAPGAAQTVEASTDIRVKSVTVTADVGAPATLTLFGKGVANLVLNVPAGTSFVWPGASGQFDQEMVAGPVTLTLAGALSFARVSY